MWINQQRQYPSDQALKRETVGSSQLKSKKLFLVTSVFNQERQWLVSSIQFVRSNQWCQPTNYFWSSRTSFEKRDRSVKSTNRLFPNSVLFCRLCSILTVLFYSDGLSSVLSWWYWVLFYPDGSVQHRQHYTAPPSWVEQSWLGLGLIWSRMDQEIKAVDGNKTAVVSWKKSLTFEIPDCRIIVRTFQFDSNATYLGFDFWCNVIIHTC